MMTEQNEQAVIVTEMGPAANIVANVAAVFDRHASAGFVVMESDIRAAVMAAVPRGYEIHVLPAGELERLRERVAAFEVERRMTDNLLRQRSDDHDKLAALIEKVRTLTAAHRFVDTSGTGEAGDMEAIRAALARYDAEKGAKP